MLKVKQTIAQNMMAVLINSLNDGSQSTDLVSVVLYAGVRPANISDAITTQVQLAKFLVDSSTGFTTVVADPSGYKVRLNISNQVLSEATDTASFFRILSEEGVTILEGDITDESGSGEMTLPTVNVVMGIYMKAESIAITIPYEN